MSVAQVEPVGLTVHLQSRSRLDGLCHYALDIDRWLAPAYLAGGWMRDAVYMGVLHRSENPLGRTSIERGVNGRQHPVQPRQLLVGEIERAVGSDRRFDPGKDAERRQTLV